MKGLTSAVLKHFAAYTLPAKMTLELRAQKVDGILIDNYALTPFPNMMKGDAIRLEKTYDHPITYGIVLSAGSEKMEKCARRYVRNYRHEIFDHVSKYLVPLGVRKLILFGHFLDGMM